MRVSCQPTAMAPEGEGRGEWTVDLVERARRILLQPSQEWQVINTEASSTADLYRNLDTPPRS
jgi:hypothetical protein